MKKNTLITVILILYLGLCWHLQHLTPFHWFFGGIILFLQIAHSKTRQFLNDAFPIFLFGLIYDLYPSVPKNLWGPVLVAFPHRLELGLLGFLPTEFFRGHPHIFLDIFAAVFYLLHFATFFFFSSYVYWKDRSLFSRFGWALLLCNILWMITVLFFPTAAPWYVELYDFAPPPLDLHGYAAGLVQFDQLIHRPFFENIFDMSRIVFGALPSMHAAWPMLMILSGWVLRKKWLNGLLITYTISTCFSVVYLRHHYVVDILAGFLYAALGFTIVRLLWKISNRNPA